MKDKDPPKEKPKPCQHCYDLVGVAVINIYRCRHCGDEDWT